MVTYNDPPMCPWSAEMTLLYVHGHQDDPPPCPCHVSNCCPCMHNFSGFFLCRKVDGATHQSWGQHHQSLSGFIFPIEGRPQLTTFLAFFTFVETCFLLFFLPKYCPKLYSFSVLIFLSKAFSLFTGSLCRLCSLGYLCLLQQIS